MRDQLAEQLLAKVMKWDSAEVAGHMPLLQSMATYKYDDYQQFFPGMRFIESLALWLQQFEEHHERNTTRDHNGMKREEKNGEKAEMKNGASGENKSTASEKTEQRNTTGQGATGAAKLSTEQRSKITTVIRQHKVAPAHLNVSIAVGTRIPERVHLYPLPAEVVDVYPEWRGYDYILVGDQILVIDPDSHEIVAILEA